MLAAELEMFEGWHLQADCKHPLCARGRSYDLKILATHFPKQTVNSVLNRLKCMGCGSGAVEALLYRPSSNDQQGGFLVEKLR